MLIGIPKETFQGENRVGLTPDVIPALLKVGFEFLMESNAGKSAGYLDQSYIEKEEW